MPFTHPSTVSELVGSLAAISNEISANRKGIDGGGGNAAAGLIQQAFEYAESPAASARGAEAASVIREISHALHLAERRIQDLGILTKSAVLHVQDRDAQLKAKAAQARQLQG